MIPEVNREQAFSQYIDRSPSGRLAFATFMNGVIAEKEEGSFRRYLRHEKQLGKNVVRIRDNGRGFDTGRRHDNRNGLKNMALRADQLNGTLSILSKQVVGTTISLTVKII